VAGGRRRIGPAFAALLLLVPLGGVAWRLYRPKPEGVPNGPPLSELDVVTLGRVDGLAPVASLEPAIPGRVLRVSVREGQEVAEGQELLALDDAALKLKVDEARAGVAAAQVEWDAADFERKQLPNKLVGLNASLAAAAERAAAARRLLEERRKQLSFNTITPAEFAAGESEIKQLEQLEVAERVRRDELAAADGALKLRLRAAEVKRGAAELAVAAAERAAADCVLAAPSAGVVLRIQVSKGEAVTPGSPRPAFLFRPAGPLVVRCELEQEFLSRVAPGTAATIRDDTRTDSPTWAGKVMGVAHWVAQKRSIVLEPGVLNDVRTVECVVAFDAPPAGLLVGQRMRVQVKR
jgi:multidrug resistance efflux pump